MAIDKNLLRQAICAGVFGYVDPDVLKTVSEMPDVEIEAKLTEWKNNRLSQLNVQKTEIDKQITQLE